MSSALHLLVVIVAILAALSQSWRFSSPNRAVSGRLFSKIGETDGSPLSGQDSLKKDVSTIAKASKALLLGIGTSSLASTAMPFIVRGANKRVWQKIDLPTRETIFDINFDKAKPEHGWLIGVKGTFLETFDGGNTWKPRTFNSLDEDEDISYRFEIASLLNDEGWIIGKPAIMLHTRDGGKQFERIPVSPKLPGEPTSIVATGAGEAEMITSQGAIYTTVNGGLNWKAQVKETIDATLNRVSSSGTTGASYFTGKLANQIRDVNGNYLAVGSRGNLFLTWSKGDDYWTPHNRGSSRRIQNMGFIQNDSSKGVWMTLNGGTFLTTSPNPDLTQVDLEKSFQQSKISSGGYGLIDASWRTPENAWVVGGSGVIFESKDGGKSFKFNEDAKDIPGNLYRIKFFNENSGYAIGSDGVLLKYSA